MAAQGTLMHDQRSPPSQKTLKIKAEHLIGVADDAVDDKLKERC